MSLKNTIILLLLLTIQQLPILVTAQENINFSSITMKDGLPSNTVNDIIKDKYGFIWFATEDGLDKFDGLTHTVYRHLFNDSTSLTENEILALHEDNAGNLWIGTGGGSLNLYNRKKNTFSNFTSQSKNNIGNHVINSICSDHLGRIWIAHFGGVDILDPKTKRISGFTYKNKPFTTVAFHIFEDSKQNMWVLTHEGVFVYNLKTEKGFQFTETSNNVTCLISNNATTIAEDKKHNIWIGTLNGEISLIEPSIKNDITSYKNKKTIKLGASGTAINSIAIDPQNNLWVGTSEGMDIIDYSTGQISHFSQNYRNAHSLTSKTIQKIYIDNNNTYWIGTIQGGINKYDKYQNLFNLVSSNPFDPQGLNGKMVNSLAESEDHNIYVATQGNGISLFNLKNETFRQINIRSNKKQTDNHLSALCLKVTKNNQLFVGTYFDGLFIVNPVTGQYKQLLNGSGANDLNSSDIFCIEQDHAGNIWVGTNGGGINVLDNNNKVIRRYTFTPKQPGDIFAPINNFIRDIKEDKQHNLWIATHGGGIAMLNTATGTFKVYNSLNSGIASNKIQSILEDHAGNIWAGTFSGLALFDRQHGSFKNYGEKEGFQNNRICKIIEDKNNLLWVSTNKGISSYNATSGKITNYDVNNGVQNSNFLHGSGMLHSNGNIFFGGTDGFNYIDPAYITHNKNIPPVVLTGLSVNNQQVQASPNAPIAQDISMAKEIKLGYKENFTLTFAGLDYTVPEQNKYAYKLEGFDKNWIYSGNTNKVSYTNLDPGEYTFSIRASNNNGIWNNRGTSIKIFVQPPFWRSMYAYFFYAFIIIGALFYSRHRGIQKLKRQFAIEQERAKVEQDRKETSRLRELDQLKIKFLTNISHEFRTPISLILGPVNTLLSLEKDHRYNSQLQIVKRNGKRLLNLVNQLLDLRKVEEHELQLHPSKGELILFIKDIADSFIDLSERKGIEFTFTSHIEKLNANFDQEKAERIFFNILSNAFKFTPAGGKITLEITEEKLMSDQSTVWVMFKIKDSGIGISEDKTKKIFERFFQDNVDPFILNQGSGIGLSIAKEFVSMQGGKIECESEIGKGATFTVLLPFETCEIGELYQTADHHSNSLKNGDAETQSLLLESSVQHTIAEQDNNVYHNLILDKQEMPSILLVEDNEDFRHYIKDSLCLHYKVLEAVDGKEGWQKALAQHPQLIVSDISMPRMDGIELCRKIRLDKRTSHIPVILLTALAGETNMLNGIKTGATDYITKPFNFELLSEKIRNTLLMNNTMKNTYTRKIEFSKPEVFIESEDDKLIVSIRSYLEENLNNSQLSVEELSRHLGMSRSSLYHKILDLTGETPVEYIRSLKLEKAAVLLEKSSMNIAQVAYSTGFSTPNYFAKSFKAKFNILPSEYILKMRKVGV